MKIKDIPQFISARYKVNITWRYLLSWIKEQETDCLLELNPDFQRGHVWTEEQQVAYVEYCLQGGRSSRLIQFNYPNWQRISKSDMFMVCVDGLQRITAVRRFLNNEIPVFGFFLKDFEDVAVSPARLPLSLDHNGWFDCYVNELETEAEVLEWYLQLNTGGTVHTQEEIERVRKMREELV